jgi:lipopolysaccharide/colanic/teichoic acid biosynthesis glycosyltransferase
MRSFVRAVKAGLDRVGAALALVLLSPLFAAIVVWIWLDDGRPALIAQERAGKDGKPFRMRKFRTMVVDAIEASRIRGGSCPTTRGSRAAAAFCGGRASTNCRS